jgi:predicted 2-oxoglutarate/Fe(II)-dependent dioxygenase YbiX
MRKELLDGEQVFVVHGLLSPEECQEYIRITEHIGYSAAPITTPSGPLMAPGVRNNERVMIDNPAWAARLWKRAKPFVPSPYLGHEATRVNERFRFYRYEEGQTFRPHTDGHYARNEERSQFTFMVYLSGDCDGGETVIYIQDDGLTLPDGAEIRVKPETGKALFFYHYLLYEGAPVRAGLKYVLRTDVMYHVGRDQSGT